MHRCDGGVNVSERVVHRCDDTVRVVHRCDGNVSVGGTGRWYSFFCCHHECSVMYPDANSVCVVGMWMMGSSGWWSSWVGSRGS